MLKDIVNCPQCSRPFHRTGVVQICHKCLNQEHGMYEFYYGKLARLVNQLNYKYISRKQSLDEERLESTLKYRLGVGGGEELPFWKRGSCNVCIQRLKNPDSTEPICPGCLDKVVRLLDKDQHALLGKPVRDDVELPERAEPAAVLALSPSRMTGRGKKPVALPQPAEAKTLPLQQAAEDPLPEEMPMVPKAMFDAVVGELDTYRTHYGPLTQEMRDTVLTGLPDENADDWETALEAMASDHEGKQAMAQHAHAVLDILLLDDGDGDEASPGGREPSLAERMRVESIQKAKFGFKRNNYRFS